MRFAICLSNSTKKAMTKRFLFKQEFFHLLVKRKTFGYFGIYVSPIQTQFEISMLYLSSGPSQSRTQSSQSGTQLSQSRTQTFQLSRSRLSPESELSEVQQAHFIS